MICLCGAITVDMLQKLYFFVKTYFFPLPSVCHYLQKTGSIMICAITVCGLLGLSRSIALYKGILMLLNNSLK